MTREGYVQFLKSYISLDNELGQAISSRSHLESEIGKCKKKPLLYKLHIKDFIVPFLGLTLLLFFVILVVLVVIETIQTSQNYAQGKEIWIENAYYNIVSFFKGLDPSDSAVFYIVNRHPVLFRSQCALISSSLLSAIFALLHIVHKGKTLPKLNLNLEKEYEMNQKRLPELESQYKSSQAQVDNLLKKKHAMENQNIIPEDYLGPYSSGKLLEYFQRGRADTLKEAINLYEYESLQEDIAEENRQHNRRMEAHAAAMEYEAQRNADASERAAAASEEAAESAKYAAFWNEASTFIIANEIDKAKKNK